MQVELLEPREQGVRQELLALMEPMHQAQVGHQELAVFQELRAPPVLMGQTPLGHPEHREQGVRQELLVLMAQMPVELREPQVRAAHQEPVARMVLLTALVEPLVRVAIQEPPAPVEPMELMPPALAVHLARVE